MPVCNTTNVQTIFDNECLSQSLSKINSNFQALQQALLSLRQRTDSRVEVRTFFYYGPNAQTDPTSGMADNQTSRPSDLTITAFVNSQTQLNLPAFSKPGDMAYVIYQKTGFLNSLNQNVSTDYNMPNSIQENDLVNYFAPIFIIWKLTSNKDNIYIVDTGFPKFTRAQTNNTTTSLSPQLWTQYNI